MDESISTLDRIHWPTDADIEALLTGPDSFPSPVIRPANNSDPLWAVALVILGAALAIFAGAFMIASQVLR
jgi:hypothetical protein